MKRIYTTIVFLLLLNLAFSQTTYYVNDNTTFFTDVFTSGFGSDANPGTAALPFATIQHAADVATEGSIIYIDAGLYTEQITLTKGLSLIGAGSGVTIIFKPAVTNPPPGPFLEKGTIQTAQNISDVHIRDMSITGDGSIGLTPIILQTGGSIKNCRLIGGSQGIFFRVDPAVKTALIENNYISIDYIGINCQGSGLSVMLINNTIDLQNPFFAAGVFAGLDFGPLVQFTAIGNLINNYNAQGFLANSYNTTITQNSILGTGQHAIEQSTGSLGIATCNWFGTTDAPTIASKVSGLFSYTPFLTNGTNTNTTYGNYSFVPVAGSCGEGGNSFYVNDNSVAGNIFTTAVGNNANSGTAAAPLATITEALARAVAGDIIYVDAGSYTEQVDITKNINIRGAGMGVTIINGPAHVTTLPGSGETGIIQTVQGLSNVILEGITIDGANSDEAHGIFIQGGGRVSNCELRYVNDGFYFSSISAQPRTAIGNSNYVHHINYVGALFAGNGLTATASNNVIDLNGATYGMGFIAGYGGDGNLASFTATNNSIINFNGFGMMVGSLQSAQVHNNSITGITGSFLQNVHGVFLNATCNWYGTTDAAVIIPNITGNVGYGPWLTNGTDNSTAIGFQSLPGVCNGRQNKFYVNDNSLPGDVFTTAVGNNSNNGLSIAPFATINFAISVAQAGDTIIVDAGTYIGQVLINKGITILGAGQGITVLERNETPPVEGSNNALLYSTAGIGDVNIKNLTVHTYQGMACIVLQTGGVIFNCEISGSATLTGKGEGIRIQTDNTDNETISIANNNIHDIGFLALTIQVPHITAYIHNNTIDVTGSSFGMGLVAGGEPHLIDGLEFIGNKIIGITGFGVKVNCNNSNVTINNNSFEKGANEFFTAPFIQNTGSNPINAMCNWLGSTDAQNVQARIQGFNVNYTPWLTNGTDNSSDIGFQPVPGSCGGTPVTVSLINTTNVTCFNASNGSISISIANGTQPYTIAWSKDGNPFSTNEDLTNLSPGTYSVIVTDANGSVASITDLVISQPSLLTASASGTNVSCFGGSNGSANVTAGDGILPYAYLWSNGSTNASISNLSAGIYSVTVTDGNGCIKSSSYQVTQPALLVVNLTGTTASCNGSATATVSGGTLPYSYLWSNGATTSSINNVPAGLYSVTVTDAHNCMASGSFNIMGNSPINPITSLVHVSCFGGSNASITITGTNVGTAPFTYNLNGSSFQSSPVFNNLPAGVYVVGVKDANGCSDFVARPINQPSAALTVVLDSLKQPCSGASTGRIFITASGGSAGKTYSWTGPNGSTSTAQDPNNIVSGNYSIVVTDGNGCTAQLNVVLPEWPPVTITESITHVLCRNELNGAINATISGGTGSGFTYSWNGPGTYTAITEDINGLKSGNYTLSVTDLGSRCVTQKTIIVTQPATLGVSAVRTNMTGCNTPGTITVTGSGGMAPYEYSLDGGTYQSSPLFNVFVTGIHTVTVRDANGCTKTINAPNITDNGSDDYESLLNSPNANNNNKAKAAPINPGATVFARIGTSGDIDYYKLGTANLWTGNYTINFVQTSVAVVFDLVASNGTTIIAPASSSATHKQYNGLSGTYYVRVSGTNSFGCYQFTVTNGTMTRSSGNNIQQEVTKAKIKDGGILTRSGTNIQQEATKTQMKDELFDVKVLGNPSSTNFILNVITSSNEKISMRVFDAQGRLIEERQGLQPMEILKIGERYINGMYMAEVRQGKNRKTIRLVKM